MARDSLDAVVVGSGPNGLTAAVTLARAGLGVRVYEGAEYIGGAAHTEELTLPGFHHDVGSAVHPMGAGSPAFRALRLEDHGLEWVHGDIAMAHPLPDGTAAVLTRSVEETMTSLDGGGRRYRRFVKPFLGRWDDLAEDFLRPVLASFPHHPLLLARFGMRALLPMTVLARALSPRTRALIAGMAGHSATPMHTPITTGAGLVFAVAGHEVGWPIARGGSQAISDALAAALRAHGGEIVTGQRVNALGELPSARAYLFDTSPDALAAITGDRLSRRYRRRLRRYKYGPSVFKIDYALSEPIPWKAEECRRAPALHVGGTYEEIAEAITAVNKGRPAERPLLVAAQPSIVDPTRAPDGKHTFWAYAHLPNGWTGDLTDAIEDQVERFAPGFRDLVLARSTLGPADLEARNPNLVGGDYACGAMRGLQSLFRPVISRVPYATPDPSIFLCSQATPPGPGVHGMCGWHAARVVLKRVFGIEPNTG
ncbi:MAG: phytoene desaturase family protein [Actinomycetota bacterium]